MKISSKRKYFIYIAAAIMMIAVVVSASVDRIKGGEIIYSRGNQIDDRITEEIVSGEDGLEIIAGSTVPTKYEDRAEFIVNINTAAEEDMIRLLPGIGSKRAAAIVEYREISGGFNSVEELCEVEGIGERLVEELLPFCTTEGPSVQYAGKQEDE